MLWLKFFHLIFIVAWFAGLFYLPRLFVYHTETHDEAGNLRFQTMEKKLFFYITLPSSLIVLLTGLWMIYERGLEYFRMNLWLHVKISLVIGLFIFQGLCWRWLKAFKMGRNTHSSKFFRIANEFPTLILIGVIYLVVFRPF